MKPDREQLEQDLLDFIEGELPPDKAARLEVYLANTDPALSQQVMDMMRQRQAMQSLPKLRAPADLAERVMEQVERTSLLGASGNDLEAPRPRWWQSRAAMAASVALLLSGFGYFMWQATQQGNSGWQANKNAPGSRIVAMDQNAGPEGGIPHSQPDGNTFTKSADAGDTPTPVAALPTNDPVVNQVALSNATALNTVDPSLAGFNGAPDPVVALKNVNVAGRSFADGPPVVLTLVATSPQDAERLRLALADLVKADEQVLKQQLALDDGLATVAEEREIADAPRMKDASPAEATRPEREDSKSVAIADGSLESTSKLRADQQTGQALKPGQSQRANRDFYANNYGYQQIAVNRQQRSDLAAQEVGKEHALNTPSVAKGATTTAPAGASVASSPDNVSFTGEANAPYRVVLRPQQVEQLARQFRVHAVTRGHTGYLIGNDELAPAGNTLNYDALAKAPVSVLNTSNAGGSNWSSSGDKRAAHEPTQLANGAPQETGRGSNEQDVHKHTVARWAPPGATPVVPPSAPAGEPAPTAAPGSKAAGEQAVAASQKKEDTAEGQFADALRGTRSQASDSADPLNKASKTAGKALDSQESDADMPRQRPEIAATSPSLNLQTMPARQSQTLAGPYVEVIVNLVGPAEVQQHPFDAKTGIMLQQDRNTQQQPQTGK